MYTRKTRKMAHKGRTYLISDLHLGHANIVKWILEDGSPARPFDTLKEMHDAILDNWNSVVRPQDKVYVLGDVVIKQNALPLLDQLQGKKCLIMGNHDIFGAKTYLKHFYDIYGVRVLPKCGLILTHIPLHPKQLYHTKAKRYSTNVHGHLHHGKLDDVRYINVCCEHVNYTPIDIDQVIQQAKEQRLNTPFAIA